MSKNNSANKNDSAKNNPPENILSENNSEKNNLPESDKVKEYSENIDLTQLCSAIDDETEEFDSFEIDLIKDNPARIDLSELFSKKNDSTDNKTAFSGKTSANKKAVKRNVPIVLFSVVIFCAVLSVFILQSVPTVDDIETTVLNESTSVSEETTSLFPVTEVFAPSHHDEIQQQINIIGEINGATGVQVAVIENGRFSDTFTYGWATVNKEEMTSEHKIRVASITKVLIGVAAMLLYEDGIIDIDESIGKIWNTDITNPYYPSDPVTVRNMLNHTSSIVSYGDDYSMRYSNVLNRFDDCFNNTRPGAFESWWYNNYVFRVLGMTLELAAQKKLDDILKEELYSVLDIDAAFAAGDLFNTEKIVTLYDEDGKIERSAAALKTFHVSDGIGEDGSYYAGGFTVSAADLAKIVSMLVCNGEYNGKQILKPESVEIMESCFSKPLEDGSYQGTPLLYMPDIYGREGIYFHTGSAYGSFNCISYDPVTGDGVVVLTTGAVDLAKTADIRYICDDINYYIYNIIA